MKAFSTVGTERSFALLFALAVGFLPMTLAPTTSYAQTAGTDAALAETLFRDGKAMMEAGNFAKACPQLVESNRLDPGTGTMLAIAICHEREGKTASAWAEFTDVAAAKKDGRLDREKLARDRIAAIEPILSRLTITIDPSVENPPGFEVKLDGAVIRRVAWGIAMPVDPGDHTVEVSANGKKTWKTSVKVGPKSDQKNIVVPSTLEDDQTGASVAATPATTAPKARTAAPLQPAESQPKSNTRTIGLVVGGAGVVALGVGVVFGLQALSKNSDAQDLCKAPAACANPDAVALGSEANTAANISNVGIGLGIVGIGVGTYLFLRSPSTPAPVTATTKARIRVAPHVGSNNGGVTLYGSF